jgi:AraC-like DNA-binding protein
MAMDPISTSTETRRSGLLVFEPPPPRLAAQLFGFVHRDDPYGGSVVRVLPEVRASIQIMIEDPYWLRDRDQAAPWTQLPKVALWGPRHQWCYGYAARHIRCYAVGLTVAGLRAVSGRAASALLNKVAALDVLQPELTRTLEPVSSEPFGAWRERAIATLTSFFDNAPPLRDPIAPTLEFLATAEGGAIAEAARLAGLSERQFRRAFHDLYGVSPKRYQRAVRVDRMIRMLHTAPWEPDLFNASPLPFADQPHAVREFRAMTGITPGHYVQAKRLGDSTLRSVNVDTVRGPSDQ